MLDITVLDSGDLTPIGDIQRAFHSILASLTSPALEHMCLTFWTSHFPTLSMQDMDSRDATTDAYRAQYADLHTVLACPSFSSLRRVTVVLDACYREELVSAKHRELKWLDFLRALFAPWYVRGIANLACVTRTKDQSWHVAVDKGEGPRRIDLQDPPYDLGTALRVAGLDF